MAQGRFCRDVGTTGTIEEAAIKEYTYQIGGGTGSDITSLVHAEEIYADSLVEAIDKAKAVTNARPERDEENTVCLLDEGGLGPEPVWIRWTKDVRS